MQNTYQSLFDKLNTIIDMDANLQNVLKESFEYKEVRKNESLLRKGEISKYIYFVHTGVLRTFYLTKFGNESTRIIALENDFCGSLSSFIQQNESFEYIEALEDSSILRIHKLQFENLISQSPKIEFLYRKILEEVQIFNMWRIESFISMEAKERYLFLKQNKPEIENRVSNKILASYLGIKPETLSRIKAK